MDSFWYDPGFEQPDKISLDANRSESINDAFLSFRRKIKKNLLQREVWYGLRMYCRSLDEAEWSSSFLKSWTVLEHATNTKDANYDRFVRRGTAIFRNNLIARQVLQHLLYRRNEIVHQSLNVAHGERLVDQLRQFVEPMLSFMIENKFRFLGMAEFAEFFDTPVDAGQRHKRCQMLKQMEAHRKQDA